MSTDRLTPEQTTELEAAAFRALVAHLRVRFQEQLKEVRLSNRLAEKPNRVAIYGWHQLDGKPIQPLTIVDVDWYVDYSHGVRLMKRTVTVDGKLQDARQVLLSPSLSPLLSDEGPVLRPSY